MSRTIILQVFICVILRVHEFSAARDVPSWHPRHSRLRVPRSQVVESESHNPSNQSDENNPVRVEIISRNPTGFEASVHSKDGCSFKSAVVQGSKAVLQADCEDSTRPTGPTFVTTATEPSNQDASLAMVNALATQNRGFPWGQCVQCQYCHPTYPPTDAGAGSRNSFSDGMVNREAWCEECYGCTASLAALGQQTQYKWSPKPVKVFLGASGAAVLKGNTTQGPVIVKFWCSLPGGWRQAKEHKPLPITCKDTKKEYKCPLKGGLIGHERCNHLFLDSLNTLTEEAGLGAITPTAWSGPVLSVLPPGHHNSSYVRVETRGQFYRVASGVSIEAVTGGVITNDNLPMLKGIPSEQIRLAATFDLLFSESDRHGQNVFVDESYQLSIIDNEGAYGPTNSMFIPGTQKYEIYRIGYGAVCCGNLPPGNCPGRPGLSSPESLLDYRCHTPGGKIGKNYPPGVMAFLEKMRNLSTDQIFEKYKMSRKEHAAVFKQRVTWMADLGFEGTLEKVLAQQEPGDGVRYGNNFSYPIHPPCCDVKTCNLRKHHSLKLE